MQKVEKHLFNDIALFKPQTFIKGEMHAVGFHIIVPSDQPPATYINGKLQSFENGKIVAINPGERLLCTEEHATKQYISLLLKPELINKIAEELGFSGDIRFLKLQNPFSGDLIQAINSFGKESGRPDRFPLMMDCLGVQIVALLLREFRTNIKKYPVNSPDCDAYIALAIEYMETFFSANITVGDISNEINVSHFHFIRTFKQKVGVPPHQYLLSVRIKKAKELLCLRQHSIAEVAAFCGFVSLSHFSSTFRGITGHSPSEYKKLYFQIYK
jgi:AraC-like DNA-binding protein